MLERKKMNATAPELFSTKDYKRSRGAYCMECAFEYFVALLVQDAFLAKLLTDIGLPDWLIGIVSSFISLAFLFQLFSVFVVQKISNTKVFVIIFHFLSQIFFMSLYLIPFLTIDSRIKWALAIGGILVAYFGNYFVTSMIYRWGNSYVHPDKRGSYGATKEMISLLTGMVVTLVVGWAMTAFEENNNLHGGFIFAAVGIFIFAVCDFVCLMLIKNDIRPKEKKESVPMREVLANTLGNKNYRNAIILAILYQVAIYTTVGFLGAFKTNELLLTVGAVQIINIVSQGARFALSKPFGRYSDKHSYIKGIELAIIVAAVAFAINIFTTPKTWMLIIPFTILYNVCQAGTTSNFLNITYSYVDKKYFVQASAIKNSICGVCGFLASVLAGLLASRIQGNGNSLFGISVCAPQVLSVISLAVLAAAFIFAKAVVEKQRVMKQ